MNVVQETRKVISATKARCAFFLPNLAGGGAERVLVNLAEGFDAEGHHVQIVLGSVDGPYVERVTSFSEVVDLKSGSVRAVKSTLKNLIGYLKNDPPDFLLCALDNTNIVAILARMISRSRTRVYVGIHNTMSVALQHVAPRRRRMLLLCMRYLYPLADGIIAVSHGAAKDLSEVAGIPLSKIDVVYNPVVFPNLFVRAAETPDHPWLAPDQPPVILSVGRFSPQKDFPNLLRAFDRVRSQVDARLIILGEERLPGERAALEALVRELGLQDSVDLPGFADNPFAYMNKSALLALSSKNEGLPTVIIEALACGCPVVSTDCPSGPREILANGKYGTLVPVSNSEALADGIVASLKRGRQAPPPESWEPYKIDTVTNQYIRLLLPNL